MQKIRWWTHSSVLLCCRIIICCVLGVCACMCVGGVQKGVIFLKAPAFISWKDCWLVQSYSEQLKILPWLGKNLCSVLFPGFQLCRRTLLYKPEWKTGRGSPGALKSFEASCQNYTLKFLIKCLWHQRYYSTLANTKTNSTKKSFQLKKNSEFDHITLNLC